MTTRTSRAYSFAGADFERAGVLTRARNAWRGDAPTNWQGAREGAPLLIKEAPLRAQGRDREDARGLFALAAVTLVVVRVGVEDFAVGERLGIGFVVALGVGVVVVS